MQQMFTYTCTSYTHACAHTHACTGTHKKLKIKFLKRNNHGKTEGWHYKIRNLREFSYSFCRLLYCFSLDSQGKCVLFCFPFFFFSKKKGKMLPLKANDYLSPPVSE